MMHVGIDLHTKNMSLAAVNNNGNLIKLESIPCNRMKLEQFFESLDGPIQATVNRRAAGIGSMTGFRNETFP